VEHIGTHLNVIAETQYKYCPFIRKTGSTAGTTTGSAAKSASMRHAVMQVVDIALVKNNAEITIITEQRDHGLPATGLT
jgi:hypothetical protein